MQFTTLFVITYLFLRRKFGKCTHALNLAVVKTIKKSKVCSDALDIAFEITKLVKFSPKI